MRDFLNVITSHMFGQASGSNQSFTKRARHDDEDIRSSSSTGVSALLNGKFAAQVYVNNNLICLGIFETEKEAATAYETTTINMWMERCKYYLQKINSGAQEPLTLENVCVTGTTSSSSVHISQLQNCARTHLFTKVLTSSDVSKISRLVIPKVFAGFFPCISDENESGSEVRPVNKVELAFYDQFMTVRNFLYCYCKKSKTYSFSKGWRKFVEEKNLRQYDKVIFFKCERVEATSVDTHFMIDVEYDRVQVEEVVQNEENGGGTADVTDVTMIESGKGLEVEGAGGAGTADDTNVTKMEAGKNMEGAGAGAGAGKAPVMLFGVNIG